MTTLAEQLAAKSAEKHGKQPPGIVTSDFIDPAATVVEDESVIATGMNSNAGAFSPPNFRTAAIPTGIQRHSPDRVCQFYALRQKSLILPSGAKVKPDAEGYFQADTAEKKEMLEYYDSLNQGLVELVVPDVVGDEPKEAE